MSIENKVLIGFIQHLTKENLLSEEEKYEISADTSIFFKYSDEFKEYLSDTVSFSSSEMNSKSISELLDMEIENGKLVDPEAEAEEAEGDNLNSEGDETVVGSSEGETVLPEGEAVIPEGETVIPEGEAGAVAPDMMPGENQGEEKSDLDIVDLLNTLFEQDEVKEVIDTDKDGELNEEEIHAFLNEINKNDNDLENLSFDDIFGAIDEIKDGTFTYGEEEIPEIETAADEQNTGAIAGNTPNAIGSGTNYSPNSGYGNYGNYGNQLSGTQEKSLANMTLEELNKELTTAQGDLSDKQTELSNIMSGNTPELEQLQANIDKAYDIYQEELKKVDEDMAKDLDDLKNAVEGKEEEINNKDIEIANQETTVSENETKYNNSCTRLEGLENTKSSLESLLATAEGEKKDSISGQISRLKGEIERAKQAKEQAKKDWDDAKDKLNALNEDRDNLQSELDKLNSDMAELEAEIAEKHPEIKQYMDNYNNAKEEYTTEKTKAEEDAKSALTEQQNYINEIATAISTKEDKQIIKEYLGNSIGEDVVEFASQFIGCNEADGSADKFLASWTTSSQTPWCAAFVEYIYENSAADSLPEWYSSIENKWSCGNLYRAGKQAGAEINGSDSQTGDMIIFDWDLNDDCNHDHVGIIVSVENGIVTTIEGNTSNEVAYRTYKIDDPRLTFFKMT